MHTVVGHVPVDPAKEESGPEGPGVKQGLRPVGQSRVLTQSLKHV